MYKINGGKSKIRKKTYHNFPYSLFRNIKQTSLSSFPSKSSKAFPSPHLISSIYIFQNCHNWLPKFLDKIFTNQSTLIFPTHITSYLNTNSKLVAIILFKDGAQHPRQVTSKVGELNE